MAIKPWRFGMQDLFTGKITYKLPKVRALELKRRLQKIGRSDDRFYLRKTGANVFSVFQKKG